MKTGAAGRAFIEKWEGLFLQAYDDYNDMIVKPGHKVRGTLTIGYGHTSAAGPPSVVVGMKITTAEADSILAEDLASVEAVVNKLVKVPLNQNQFDALVSFEFNTGGLAHSTLLRCVSGESSATAIRAAFMMWDKVKHRVVKGLANRRRAEADLFLSPSHL